MRFFAVVVFIIGTASSEVASSVGENFQLQPNRQPQAAVVVGGSGFYPGEGKSKIIFILEHFCRRWRGTKYLRDQVN